MSSHEGKFEEYMKQKDDSPEKAPCNHPEFRLAVLVDHLLDKTDDALRTQRRMGYRIHRARGQAKKLNDVLDGYERVVNPSLTKEQQEQLKLIIEDRKNTVDILVEHLDMADDIHIEESQILTEINNKLKEEQELGASSRSRNRREGIIKPLLLELAYELRISTKMYPVSLMNRLILEDVFFNFRTFVFDFIFPLASAKRCTAFLCLNCWTIMFLYKEKLKNSKYVKPGWIELRTLFHEDKVERNQPALNTFYSAIGWSEEEALLNGPQTVTPNLTLPGERQAEGRGHQCHWEPEPEPRDILCTRTKDTRGQTPEGGEEFQDAPPLQIAIPESPPPKPKKKTIVTPLSNALGKRKPNSFEDETMDENKSQSSEDQEPTLLEMFIKIDDEIRANYDDFSSRLSGWKRTKGDSNGPSQGPHASDRPISDPPSK